MKCVGEGFATNQQAGSASGKCWNVALGSTEFSDGYHAVTRISSRYMNVVSIFLGVQTTSIAFESDNDADDRYIA